jgi:outer membrane protein with beta-barrel domain
MRMVSLTVVVCVLAGATQASAQTSVEGGVIGGPGRATLIVKAPANFPDFSGRAGMAIGGFFVTPTRHGIGLEPEVLVIRKGARATQGPVQALFRLTSLEIPVLLRFAGPAAPRKVAFHALVGPAFGVRLKARQVMTAFGSTQDQDYTDQIRAFEVALAAGAGVDVARLRVDGRFTSGLTRVNTDTAGNTTAKSRMFTVLAGVRLF